MNQATPRANHFMLQFCVGMVSSMRPWHILRDHARCARVWPCARCKGTWVTDLSGAVRPLRLFSLWPAWIVLCECRNADHVAQRKRGSYSVHTSTSWCGHQYMRTGSMHAAQAAAEVQPVGYPMSHKPWRVLAATMLPCTKPPMGLDTAVPTCMALPWRSCAGI